MSRGSQAVTRQVRRRPHWRAGNIVVFAAILLVVMVAMLAFSIDVGYMYTMQAQLQRSVDAAALAGAADLVNGTAAAEASATEYLVRNPVGSDMQVFDETTLANAKAQFLSDHGSDMEMKMGSWDPDARRFTETSTLPSSIFVKMQYPTMPLFFGRVLGKDTFAIEAQSTAMYQPRDIALVLDFSGSMNDDSTFAELSRLGRTAIETNLQQIWTELGSPVYGNLGFAPQWAVVQGTPENTGSSIPHISVEYRYNSVYVTSTQNITTVKLEFSGGSQQSFSPSNTTASVFQGTGGNSSKQITKVWVKSWQNTKAFGSNGEYFDFTSGNINNTLITALGLDNVTYPYSKGGSWNSYINYVKSSSNDNKKAGYRYKFGAMNLITMWLDNYAAYKQVPDLWKVSAQPVTALKGAVSIFMDFMRTVQTDDRVALIIYDADDGEAILEHSLTTDLNLISDTVAHRQAGHYTSYTNIGAGMHTGRLELDENGRSNAFKMVVLMTDGNANYAHGQYSESVACQYVYDEAALAANQSRRYPILTIGLGAGADKSILQSVADTTKGKFFDVPGGSSIEDYNQQLKQVFKDIANARPLKIVQ